MIRTATLMVALLLTIAAPAAGAADDAAAEASPTPADIDWLFVQNADSGTLEAASQRVCC